MRRLVLAIALTACGGPVTTPDSGSGVDSGARDAGTLDAQSPRDAGTSGGIAPVIRMIAWTHATPCTNRDREVTVTTTVEDPDTPASALVFSGNVGGCTGMLDAATSTVVCRGTSPTIAFVHVEDEGGRAADQAGNIEYCVDGSVSF